MRVIAILISTLFLSVACNAQQARQMQKTGTAAQGNTTSTVNSANTTSASAAPRQMMPVSGKPVKTTSALATPVPADSKPREMTPVKGQQVMRSKN